jgi:hypothetical protein
MDRHFILLGEQFWGRAARYFLDAGGPERSHLLTFHWAEASPFSIPFWLRRDEELAHD